MNWLLENFEKKTLYNYNIFINNIKINIWDKFFKYNSNY